MEFNIRLSGPAPQIGAIEQALHAVDPAALVDIDPDGHTLRVAASIDAAQLVSLINQAGHKVATHQVAQAPSICCGGCSG
jgi:hypothetical protein